MTNYINNIFLNTLLIVNDIAILTGCCKLIYVHILLLGIPVLCRFYSAWISLFYNCPFPLHISLYKYFNWIWKAKFYSKNIRFKMIYIQTTIYTQYLHSKLDYLHCKISHATNRISVEINGQTCTNTNIWLSSLL